MACLVPLVVLLSLGGSTEAGTGPSGRAAPVHATFTDMSLAAVLHTLGTKADVFVVLDGQYCDKKVSYTFQGETFDTALGMITEQNGLFVKELDPRILRIAPDTPERRAYYEAWVERRPTGIAVTNRGALGRSFHEASLSQVLTTIGDLAGVKVLFDADFRDKLVSFKCERSTFEEALRVVCLTNGLFVKALDPRTIVVVFETPLTLRKYDAWSPGAPLMAVRNRAPLHLSFTDAALSQVLDAVGNAAGVTIAYDANFRDERATIRFDGDAFEAALDQLTLTHRLLYKQVDAHTVIIAPDFMRSKYVAAAGSP